VAARIPTCAGMMRVERNNRGRGWEDEGEDEGWGAGMMRVERNNRGRGWEDEGWGAGLTRVGAGG